MTVEFYKSIKREGVGFFYNALKPLSTMIIHEVDTTLIPEVNGKKPLSAGRLLGRTDAETASNAAWTDYTEETLQATLDTVTEFYVLADYVKDADDQIELVQGVACVDHGQDLYWYRLPEETKTAYSAIAKAKVKTKYNVIEHA